MAPKQLIEIIQIADRLWCKIKTVGDKDKALICLGITVTNPPTNVGIFFVKHYSQIKHQELNGLLLDNCKEDKKTFCQGVEPRLGSDPLGECLEAHLVELSESCQDALLSQQAEQVR